MTVACELDSLQSVLGEEPRPFPRELYVEPEWLALELDAFFRSGWFAACSEEDVAAPGSWVRVPLPEESLLVVRSADLSLAAVHDVCRHRGTQLAAVDAGRQQALCFTCPYHGWTYELAGALRRAPGMPADFDAAAHGLATARVATRYGQVFVSLDPAAPPFEAWLGDGPPWLQEGRHGPVRRLRRVQWEVAANWKLLVENFQESHHFPLVHPGLEALTPFAASRSVVTDGPWQGGVMALREGVESVSQSGRLNGRPLIAGAEVCDALVAPALLTSLQPDYLLTYRLMPLAVDRTRVVGEIALHPAALVPGDLHADLTEFWDRTNAEDRDICERQQRGLASRAASPRCYAPSEDGVVAFDRWVARGLAAQLETRR